MSAYNCQAEDTVGFTVTLSDSNGNPLALDNATVKRVLFYSPNKTTTEIVMDFVTDGTDGQLECTADETFFNASGTWKYQYHVTTPAGNWHTQQLSWTVGPILST